MIFAAGDRSIDRSIARGPPNKSTQRERERERERKVYGFSPIHLIRVATADGRVSIVMAEVNCVCKKKKKKTPLCRNWTGLEKPLSPLSLFFFFSIFFYFYFFLFSPYLCSADPLSSLKPAEASAMATRTKPSLGLCRRGGIPERFWRLVPRLHLGRPKLYDVETQFILSFFFFTLPTQVSCPLKGSTGSCSQRLQPAQ